jgi:SAM-dependent methyltransferase
MDDLLCSGCAFEIRECSGIWLALAPERMAHYARFIADYERIRAAEGRGGIGDNFYVALPYRDLSGRNSRQWQIRARSFDYVLRRILQPALKQGSKVLDLGAGNGWMSFRLALAGYAPFAVDLLTNDHDGLGAAEHYRGSLSNIFPRFQAEMTHLPFADGQFDAVVFNASFHYVEDAQGAMREVLRCVRTNGLVIICDTPWYASEASGRQMVEERRAAFLKTYGTASDSIESVEFLTPACLHSLEQQLNIRWAVYSPNYGFRWAIRPLIAKLRQKREPSRFRIYVTRKSA